MDEDSKVIIAFFVMCLIMVLGVVAGITITALSEDAHPRLCHSLTEDSRILDCDFRNGAWHPR